MLEPGKGGANALKLGMRVKNMSKFSEHHSQRLKRRRSILPAEIAGSHGQHAQHQRFYFHPFSYIRLCWEAVISAVALLHVLCAPMLFAWKSEMFSFTFAFAISAFFYVEMFSFTFAFA